VKTQLMNFGFSILIALSLASSPVSAFAADTNPSSEVFDQINAIRVEHGLAPLVVNSMLTASAQGYATTLGTQNFFAHHGLDGSTLITRDEAEGYTDWSHLEENLAAGQPSATAAVNAWMNSPSHRADLLSPNVTETGIGYVYVAGSRYGYYWVQEFGARWSD
jgi:uncharacterized protein YkwD